jgi:hypothetical protein
MGVHEQEIGKPTARTPVPRLKKTQPAASERPTRAPRLLLPNP